MVSLSNAITIGAALAGIGLFFGLGGASGIGNRIGTGLRSFGESITQGLTGSIVDSFGYYRTKAPLLPPGAKLQRNLGREILGIRGFR